ncbi:MAG: PDZ domain-containing protein, partial [Candidatus Eremiobacteraeota bacterium]|nr:PDZ domain-containing protein [Candidatus Eremiobacteraeota bacterium]
FGLETTTAAVVTDLDPQGAATAAGIRAGDLIIKAGERIVRSPDDLQVALGEHHIGEPLIIEVLRSDERVRVETTPTELRDAA